MSDDASPGRCSSESTQRERRQRGGKEPSSEHEAGEDMASVGGRIRSAPACADSPPQRCSRSPRCWPSARGGYFGVTRVRVAILACLLLALAAVVAERPLPRSTPGRLALGGLAALTAWTGV